MIDLAVGGCKGKQPTRAVSSVGFESLGVFGFEV